MCDDEYVRVIVQSHKATYPHLYTCDLLNANMRRTLAQLVSLQPGILTHPLKHMYGDKHEEKTLHTACKGSIYVRFGIFEYESCKSVFAFR